MGKKMIIIINIILFSILAAALLKGAYNTTDHFSNAVKRQLRGTGILWEEVPQGEYSVLVTEDSPEEDVQLAADAVNMVLQSGKYNRKDIRYVR